MIVLPPSSVFAGPESRTARAEAEGIDAGVIPEAPVLGRMTASCSHGEMRSSGTSRRCVHTEPRLAVAIVEDQIANAVVSPLIRIPYELASRS